MKKTKKEEQLENEIAALKDDISYLEFQKKELEKKLEFLNDYLGMVCQEFDND